MKFVLGLLLTLVSLQSFAHSGECVIEGYAQNNFSGYQIYKFLNRSEMTDLKNCEQKFEKTVSAIEQCMMVPAGRVSHIKMDFFGVEKVSRVEYINSDCGPRY